VVKLINAIPSLLRPDEFRIAQGDSLVNQLV
jgi:hypothetical protein